jgi:hypothetical protein
MQPRNLRVFVVGACYQDVILHVERYRIMSISLSISLSLSLSYLFALSPSFSLSFLFAHCLLLSLFLFSLSISLFSRKICVNLPRADVLPIYPSYPREDSKVRAQQVEKRRGGNGSNTLTILSQYSHPPHLNNPNIHESSSLQTTAAFSPSTTPSSSTSPSLHCELVCVFAGTKETAQSDSFVVSDLLQNHPTLSLSHCLFRGHGYSEPTAWIISTHATRTIINHTTVPEYTASEFEECVVNTTVRPMLAVESKSESSSSSANVTDGGNGGGKEVKMKSESIWFHFEGRNVGQVQQMLHLLNQTRASFGWESVSGTYIECIRLCLHGSKTIVANLYEYSSRLDPTTRHLFTPPLPL